MSFCEDDCEISSTSARTAAVVVKVRPKTSRIPTMPGPPTVINATSLMAESAFTPLTCKQPLGVILVPGRSGEKVLRIHRGMSDCMRGRRVLGWRTLAPNCANSAASR